MAWSSPSSSSSSSSSSPSRGIDFDEKPHVLAVDDSLIDRKVIERLLINSVVVVSSENIPTRIKQCLEEGAREFLLKPLGPSDVTKLRCQIKKLKNPCQGMLFVALINTAVPRQLTALEPLWGSWL